MLLRGMLSITTLITGAFPGIYCGALPGMCWAADSRRILLDTAQRSQQVRDWWGTQGRPGWVRTLDWTLPSCP